MSQMPHRSAGVLTGASHSAQQARRRRLSSGHASAPAISRRGDVRADQRARQPHPVLGQDRGRTSPYMHVQLDQRRAAHAVRGTRSPGRSAGRRGRRASARPAAAAISRARCRAARGAGPARRGCRRRPPSRRRGQVEGRACRPRARCSEVSATPIAAPAGVHAAGRSSATAASVAALLGGRARDLLQQHGRRRRRAARPCPGAVLHRDVVVDHARTRPATPVVRRGQLGGHLEVHHVARVVLDDVHDTGAAVDALGRREHLVGHRGGEHLARRRRRPASRAPTNPPCSGSCPEPPPEMRATLPAVRRVATIDDLVLMVDAAAPDALPRCPRSASVTTFVRDR